MPDPRNYPGSGWTPSPTPSPTPPFPMETEDDGVIAFLKRLFGWDSPEKQPPPTPTPGPYTIPGEGDSIERAYRYLMEGPPPTPTPMPYKTKPVGPGYRY